MWYSRCALVAKYKYIYRLSFEKSLFARAATQKFWASLNHRHATLTFVLSSILPTEEFRTPDTLSRHYSISKCLIIMDFEDPELAKEMIKLLGQELKILRAQLSDANQVRCSETDSRSEAH